MTTRMICELKVGDLFRRGGRREVFNVTNTSYELQSENDTIHFQGNRSHHVVWRKNQNEWTELVEIV